jgi:hypothetical protein
MYINIVIYHNFSVRFIGMLALNSYFICSETCINQISLAPTYVFVIDRFSVYAGKTNKDFLLWEFISSPVYTGRLFIQESLF